MSPDPRSRVRASAGRLVIAALLFWAAAAVVYGSLREIYGERSAFVHVRWAASVDEPQRASLERRYGLTRGTSQEGTTWGYYLANLSRANIRALVVDPLVEDTHYIHRTRFRIWRTAKRGDYVQGDGPPATVEMLVFVLLIGGAIAAALAVRELAEGPAPTLPQGQGRPEQGRGAGLVERLAAPQRVRSVAFVFAHGAASILGRLVRWFANRIPPASPQAVALVRVVLGAGVVAIALEQAVSSEYVVAGQTANIMSKPQEWAMQAFLAAPAAADWLSTWILVWGALFIAGAMTRTAFVMLAAGASAWALLYSTRIGAHSISALIVTLLCLIWSRWGDAWSVDAWVRRRRGLPARRGSAREYGYTIWLPGVVLGVTFAAAAIAKIRGGPDWILNGTVKYHFLSDSPDALVDWGAGIARHPNLAVLLSFAAVAIESLVIVGALSRRYRYRAAAGAGALSILIGFVLFQGIFWPAWWLLLLAFLPWHRLPGRELRHGESSRAGLYAPPGMTPALSPLGRLQAAIVLAIVFQQIAVSALRLEVDPFFSTYDMYSTTYESPEDYMEKSGMTYWVIGRFDDGTTSECRVSQEDAELLSRLPRHATDWGPAAPVLERCVREHHQRFEEEAALNSVTVEGRTVAVDWNQWRLAGEHKVPLGGPIPVAVPSSAP